MSNFNNIQELLRKKADFQTRLSLIPYTGTPEIKENKSGKYLYIRKREHGKLKSIYVDKFSDELYQTLLRYSKEARELNKEIRKIEKELALLNYVSGELTPAVQLNLDFARANMKANIYDQAILEGVATTFPQTETIIENGKVTGMRASDVQKILNLKHAWEFIMDKDVIGAPTDFYILSYIAGLVNEGFYEQGGRVRGVPVAIGGATYVPPIPNEIDVKEAISNIISRNLSNIDKAIELCLYCMKTQIFNDGNKRASVIFANHFMIANAEGLIVIPEKEVPEFKKLLVEYYEDKDTNTIKTFLKEKCWKKVKQNEIVNRKYYMEINEIKLSKKTLNYLKRNGIETIEQLLNIRNNKSFPYLTPYIEKEIVDCLLSQNLYLKEKEKTAIDKLELSVKDQNLLKRIMYKTQIDLFDLSLNDLSGFKGCGLKTAEKLYFMIQELKNKQ